VTEIYQNIRTQQRLQRLTLTDQLLIRGWSAHAWTEVSMPCSRGKLAIFWDVTPCNMVGSNCYKEPDLSILIQIPLKKFVSFCQPTRRHINRTHHHNCCSKELQLL